MEMKRGDRLRSIGDFDARVLWIGLYYIEDRQGSEVLGTSIGGEMSWEGCGRASMSLMQAADTQLPAPSRRPLLEPACPLQQDSGASRARVAGLRLHDHEFRMEGISPPNPQIACLVHLANTRSASRTSQTHVNEQLSIPGVVNLERCPYDRHIRDFMSSLRSLPTQLSSLAPSSTRLALADRCQAHPFRHLLSGQPSPGR